MLGLRAGRERGGFHAGPGQRTLQFLAPVRHIAGRTVTVNHPQGGGAGVGELVENRGGNIDGLACFDRASFRAQAHLTLALENQVNLFLLLIVPRDLAAMGLERDAPHREIFCLDRAGSPYQILRSAPRRISAAGNFCEVGNGHCVLSGTP